jgi:predicted small secreted protein
MKRSIGLIVLVAAATLLASCDNFEPTMAIGQDGAGNPVIHPVYCSPDERIVSATIADTGVDNFGDLPGEDIEVWKVESDIGNLASLPLGVDGGEFLRVVTPWTTPLASYPPQRYLRVTIAEHLDGTYREYDDVFRVEQFQVSAGNVHARFYREIPLAQFHDEVVAAACPVEEGVFGGLPNLQPRWLSFAFGPPSLLILPALGGLLWGAIVLGQRLKRRLSTRNSH